MTKAGERLLRGAEQALAYAQGRAKPDSYRVHNPEVQKITSRGKPIVVQAQFKPEQHGSAMEKNSSEEDLSC